MKSIALAILCFVAACSSGQHSLSKNQDAVLVTPTLINLPSFDEPTGNELEIGIQQLRRGEYEIIVENVSQKTVYCSYLPGYGSERTNYFPYRVEFKRSGEEVFTLQPTAQHSVPPLVPIAAGTRVIIPFFPPDPDRIEPGEYRIRFGYAVDPEVERIERTIPPEEIGEELEIRLREAFVSAISPVFSTTGQEAKSQEKQ